MAKTKGVRIGITLECQTSEGVYRYRTTKNRRNTPDRLELKKYCPLIFLDELKIVERMQLLFNRMKCRVSNSIKCPHAMTNCIIIIIYKR